MKKWSSKLKLLVSGSIVVLFMLLNGLVVNNSLSEIRSVNHLKSDISLLNEKILLLRSYEKDFI